MDFALKFLSTVFTTALLTLAGCDRSPSEANSRLYGKAERVLVEGMPCAFMYHRIFYVMHHEWIGNFKPNAYKPNSFGYGLSKYYGVNAARRAAYQRKNKKGLL